MEYGRLCQCLLQAADLLLRVVLPLYAPSNHGLVSMVRRARIQDAVLTTGRRDLRLLNDSHESIHHFLSFQRHQRYNKKDNSQFADLPIANRRVWLILWFERPCDRHIKSRVSTPVMTGKFAAHLVN